MPSFTITATGQQVALDNAGAGQAAFTVTNTTPQQFGGRLVVRPTEPAKAEWFKVTGEPIRQFAPNGAEQVVVAVSVPPGTPPATYSFRLDAISEVHPDEDFTEGPTVSFVVAGKSGKKPFPIWIPIVALLVLIGIGVASYFLFIKPDDPPKPPDNTANTTDTNTTPQEEETEPPEETVPPETEPPAPPDLTVPPMNETFAVGSDGKLASVPVAWNAVENARFYRVELERCVSDCGSGDNEVKTSDTTAAGHVLSFEEGANEGVTEWEVRVVAISADGAESSPSEGRRFKFAQQPPPDGGGGPVVIPEPCRLGYKICNFRGDEIVVEDMRPSLEELLQNNPDVVTDIIPDIGG